MRNRQDKQEANRQQAEQLKGNTPTLILAVLQAGSLHGYAIARQIEQRSSGAFALGEGSLYPALRALERDGMVVSQWEIQATGPARKVYALTEAGRAELAERTHDFRRFTASMELLLRGMPDAQPI